MSETQRRSEALELVWVAGITVAVVGGLALAFGLDTGNNIVAWFGWVVSGLGSVLLTIAVIATGVRIGVTTTRP